MRLLREDTNSKAARPNANYCEKAQYSFSFILIYFRSNSHFTGKVIFFSLISDMYPRKETRTDGEKTTGYLTIIL